MTKESRTAHVFTIWEKLKKDKTIISDNVSIGSWDSDADAMLFIMESVFNHHDEVKELLKMLEHHNAKYL